MNKSLLLATVHVFGVCAISSLEVRGADIHSVREWYVNQPLDFSNSVLFEREGLDFVRSSRFAQGSQVFGDFDGDGDVDQHDYIAMQICLSFSGPGFATPSACQAFDYDGDDDIDLQDVAEFQIAYVGSLSGVLVEAGELVPVTAAIEGYYSGAPGTPGNNALNGIARHAGYTQDDLWYEWKLIHKPEGSGQMVIANSAIPATAFSIFRPMLPGTYAFELKVTNLVTLEFGLDLVELIAVECSADGDCNDGEVCTVDTCYDGACQSNAIMCDDGLACTVDACNPNTGTCTFTDNCIDGFCNTCTGECDGCEPGVACDDSNFCTNNDICTNGVCVGTPVTCPSGQVCNTSTGNCQVVTCTSSADCSDGASCTTDTCNLGTGTCEFTLIDTACNDNLFCNGTEGAGSCDPEDADAEAGTGCVRPGDPCANPTPVCNEATDSCQACTTNAECNDGFSCTSDTCGGGSCTNTTLNTSCPDPLKCDGDDVCDPTHSEADATTGCYAPGNPCAPKVCNEATYVVGDAATCTNCASNIDCSDGIACTQDTCDGGTGNCTNTPSNILCPDTLFCNGDDECDPNDPDAGADGCVNALENGYPCANACNETTNTCFACTSNLDCSDGVACTTDTCNGGTGACTHTDNCPAGTCNLQNGQCDSGFVSTTRRPWNRQAIGDADGDGIDDCSDNCPNISNANQADADSDGVGNACDNCPNTVNTGQADGDGDGDGNVCDNCPSDSNPNQANSDGDACGDACDEDCGGGGPLPDPVQVNAGADQSNICSGSTVTLDGTSVPAQPTATIRWSQVGVGPATGVSNAADPANFVAPAASSGAAQAMTFQATGSAAGFSNGSDTVLVQTRPLDTNAILTKSSGAAQPGEIVSIDLADEENQLLDIVWVQDAADIVRVTLSQTNGSHEATFTAPNVAATTDLHFVAIGACVSGQPGTVDAGKQTVSIQKATGDLNLPATINEGATITLTTFTTVNNAPVGFELLYFASAVGSSDDLPVGVIVTVDQDGGTLTIDGAPAGASQIEVTVMLFGTAGLLATDSDTISIQGNLAFEEPTSNEVDALSRIALESNSRRIGEATFSYSADGGLIPKFGTTDGFGNYHLFMEAGSSDILPAPATSFQITSLELVLTDLTHTHPEDLDIYLISPFGKAIEIMTDKGGGIAVVNMDLIFNDGGAALRTDGLPLTPGTYSAEDSTGPGAGSGFARYIGTASGTDAWELIIIDDSPGDQGSLGSYTLRGTYVGQ